MLVSTLVLIPLPALSLSRVKYGGKVSNTIVLDTPIVVFGDIRERVLMDTEELVLL